MDPDCLEAYTACRLIPLNKNPGVRPIGVGEVLRRIVGKSIAWALRSEVQSAAGPLQMSSGLQGGAEAAIHSMREIFNAESTDAVILVDAANAFNNLNRMVALHNIQYICPPLSTTLINTYRQPSRLFLPGEKEILSQEGTTQGDPLAMQFYALATNPLIHNLQLHVKEVSQVWLADDATGAGKLEDLKRWWDLIIEDGRKLGYEVNEKKSWLIVKRPSDLNKAQNIFEGSEIQFTTSGQRHLGASIGSNDFKTEYITAKVEKWCEELRTLSEIAKSQPHAAFSAYIYGQQHKYRYFMRTIKDISACLQPLDNVITNIFIPTVMGFNISNAAERELLSLPVKNGGMGIEILTEISDAEFDRSVEVTAPLAAIIAMQGEVLPNQEEVRKIKSKMRAQKSEAAKIKTTRVDSVLESDKLRIIHQLREPGASNWLSALPLTRHNINLNKGEFRDACALRYDKPLQRLPSQCVCGQPYNVTHAMNCKRGGFISARHDNIRDFEASLLSQVCKDVETEPQLQPISNECLPKSSNTSDDARLDVRARGFWRRSQNAYFDIRVTNANAESQKEASITNILNKHEKEKKRKYNARVMQIESGTFTPLVFTTVGSMGPETAAYHKSLAEKIAMKTDERYSDVICYIRTMLSCLSVKSALLCLRGSRGHRAKMTAANDFSIVNEEMNL